MIKDEIAKNLSATLKEFITAAIRIDNCQIECVGEDIASHLRRV